MKFRHLFLMFSLAFIVVGLSTGYSDSRNEQVLLQVDQSYSLDLSVSVVAFAAELPSELVVSTPDLGRPASKLVMVSEELTDALEMCIRPPPELGQKSEFNIG